MSLILSLCSGMSRSKEAAAISIPSCLRQQMYREPTTAPYSSSHPSQAAHGRMGPPPSPMPSTPSSSQHPPSTEPDLQPPSLDHGTLNPIGEDGEVDEELESDVSLGVHTGSETKPEPSAAGGLGPGRPDQPMSGPSAPASNSLGLRHQAVRHLQPAGLTPRPSGPCTSASNSHNPAESAAQPSSVSDLNSHSWGRQQQDQSTVGRPGSCEAGAPTSASDAPNVEDLRQHPQQQHQHQQDDRPQHPNPSSSSGGEGSGIQRAAAGGQGGEGQQVWVWRTPLERTQPFWAGWYRGLSEAFLKVPAPKVLMLAGTDRLDKPLMVGQMQGRFQLSLLPQVIPHCLDLFWNLYIMPSGTSRLEEFSHIHSAAKSRMSPGFPSTRNHPHLITGMSPFLTLCVSRLSFSE